MVSPFFGEFIGTLVLILLGNGVVAGVVLKGSKAEQAGWMVITTGWAFAVFCGVVTAIACGGPGHLNPAVTVAIAVTTGQAGDVGTFVLAQMLGAISGATLVWLFYLPHWAGTPDPGAKRAAFCNTPAIRHLPSNFFCEVLATMVLVVVATALGSQALVAPGALPAPGLSPYFVAIVVWSVGLSLGGTTGYAINPARDLGPRIAHAILPVAGKGDSDWGYAAVPVMGPLVGGVLAGLFIRLAGI